VRAADAAPPRIAFEAPAKLNLGLRIVGRRDDGYHLLESLFVPLDLADDLVLDVREGAGVELALVRGEAGEAPPADVPCDERNLAVRAALAFLGAAALECSVRIELRKRIPSSAGLGGGSSDAAAVLRALDRAWPGRVDAAQLADLALSLGADVPFFLDPRPALVRGIGEHRAAPGALPALAFVLANPRRALSTAEVFARRASAGAAFSPEGQLERDLAAVRAAGWSTDDAADAWAALLANDLAVAAESLCPEMAVLRQALDAAGALSSGQSGSGATVFGVFADRAAAQLACASLSSNDSAWFRVAISPAAR